MLKLLSVGVAVCILGIAAAPAAAPRNRTPVLLVGKPQVSAVDKGAADLIYASIIAGLHDALLRRIDPPASREFGAVFTERSITDEQKTKIAPLVLFAKYTSQDLNMALERRFEQAQQFRLARFLEITIAELSPANYEITLAMYEPATWVLRAEKRIGGCTESIEDLTAQARELAATLIEASSARGVPPSPKIEITPPSADNTYLVGTRITLDSCGIENRSGDLFTVTWTSTKLKGAVHRRRISLVLDRPETALRFEQSTGGESSAGVNIKVIAPPRADPVIEKCAKTTEDCKEAFWVPIDFKASTGGVPAAYTFSTAGEALETFAQVLAARSRAESENPVEVRMRPIDERKGAIETERRSSSGDLRLIRLEQGINHIKLTATGVAANQSVLWTQLSGPEIGAGNVNNQVLTFQLDSKKSGYYVFKLAVSSGTLQTAEAKISFLAAPSIHADAGRSSYTGRVGQPILLDGSASYDVLGDQISFTWVLTDPEQQRAARIVDNHGSHPRFIAGEPGSYSVQMFARVTRKIDDALLSEIAVATTTVKVSDVKLETFLDTYGSSTTPQVYRAGVAYAPAINHFSTIARTWSYRSLLGAAAGRGGEKQWTVEGFAGLGVRIHDRLVLDFLARLYSRQNEDASHRLGFGVGANLSISVWGGLLIQIKGRLGPPTIYSPDAPSLFAWEPGLGIAYEL